MASAAVHRALTARLVASWAHTRIDKPNDGGSPPSDGSAFLTYEFPMANETMETTGAPGNNYYREDGAFRVILRLPMGEGIDPDTSVWPDRINTLRAAFRGFVSADRSVTVFEVGPPITNDSSDQGSYFDMSFAALYTFRFLG